MKRFILMVAALVLVLSGCAGTGQQAKMDSPKQVLSKDGQFFVYDYQGRYYVVGSEESSKAFAAHHHLPYTKTLLGAGPHGETVIFEVPKKNPEVADRLIETYQGIPFLVETKGDNYAVYKYMGRLYVVGSKASSEKFAAHHHMPYAKTLLGAGPAGETVVFEIDTKDPTLVERLMKQFKG